MILRNATIKYSGINPDTLSHGSNKRICVSCDKCGRVKWVQLNNYRSLCKFCGKKGIQNTLGYKHTKESIEKIKKASTDRFHSNKTKRKMSKNNARNNLGKHHSIKTKNKIRESMPDRSGENNPNWKGGITGIRTHVLPINQCLHINKRFNDSHAHHISSDVIIFIPSELHNHINHSLKDNKGMYEMNLLSFQYLRGWL